MAFQFPWTNLHELNLDWFLSKFKQFTDNFLGTTATAESVPYGTQPSVTVTGGELDDDTDIVDPFTFNFKIPAGQPGTPGTPGQDGFSPTATVTKSGDTATISITDKNGTTTATVKDGPELDNTLTQSGQAADAKATGDAIDELQGEITQINSIIYTDNTYDADVSKFEYGAISVNSITGYSYLNSGRQIRTIQNYYIHLNQGDKLSIGDGSVTLTLVSDGTTVTKTLELWAGWYNPATNKYEQRAAQTADIVAPITGDYVVNLRLTDYSTHFLTIYTDAIAKMAGALKIIRVADSNIRLDFNSAVRKFTKNPNCKFIAHQGYTSEAGVNNNRLQGYIEASERGFDWAETDLRLTSDEYIVCCHDATFVDATSGVTVTIADSTLAQLQTHDYYGTTIATFEEVLSACKMNGLGLVLDQLSSATLVNKAYSIVKEYGMLDHVAWSVQVGDGGRAVNTIVLTNYPKATVFTTSYSATATDNVTFAESIATANNHVYASIPYTSVSENELKTITASLSNNVGIAIWAPDTIDRIKPLMPYIEFVFSNKIAYYDVYSA